MFLFANLQNIKSMMNEAIHTIMTRNPISLSPKHTISDVETLFKLNRIHHLPVVDDGKLIGLVTTYDLWSHRSSDAQTTFVTDIMNTCIVKISAQDKIGTAAELFLDNRFHALPVMEGDTLVGIVTTFDVLKYEFRKEYENIILYKDAFEPKLRTA